MGRRLSKAGDPMMKLVLTFRAAASGALRVIGPPLTLLGVFGFAAAGGAQVVGGAGQRQTQSAPVAHAASVGSTSAMTTPNTSPSAQNSQDYFISPDDLLEMYVVDVQELSRAYRVSPTGSVTIPLLARPIHAAGLTLDELASRVEWDLRASGLVTNPHVSVTAKESQAHSVAVTGAVNKPHLVPVFSHTTLIEVLSEAGGPTESAGSTVRVARGDIGRSALRGTSQPSSAQGQNETQTLMVDLKNLLDGDPGLNVPIFPGDTVTIPLGGVVYVVGAVNKPGGFVLSTERHGMTVLQALALAEDAKPTAVRDKALIVRQTSQSDGARQEIPVKLGQIISGKATDVALQPNDILFVPDSAGRKALRRGAEAAIQLVTGVVVWGRY